MAQDVLKKQQSFIDRALDVTAKLEEAMQLLTSLNDEYVQMNYGGTITDEIIWTLPQAEHLTATDFHILIAKQEEVRAPLVANKMTWAQGKKPGTVRGV